MSSDASAATVPHKHSHPNRPNAACLQCRERKVRCSGNDPCTHCVRRMATCQFAVDEKKIMVSESVFCILKRKAAKADESTPQWKRRTDNVRNRPSADDGGYDDGEDNNNDDDDEDDDTNAEKEYDNPGKGTELGPLQKLRNPLVSSSPRFVTDFDGRKRFLGPSSTWSYSRQVMVMIREYMQNDESPEVPLNVDGSAVHVKLSSSTQDCSTISMKSLPSLDYATYLAQTVKFHVAQTYALFHEPHFSQTLQRLYENGLQPLTVENRLSYVQFFLIMAFGRALLARSVQFHSTTGNEYFLRAMELLPGVDELYKDPILAVEICCGLALYLQAIDHRNSAYIYLGIGLRISFSQGFHRDMDMDSESGAETEATRRRSVWWTLYILDRKFSSLMGAPNSIQDEDIAVPLPLAQEPLRKPNPLEIHVKLSRLIAKVLNTIYGIEGRLDSNFFRNIQAMLRELAAIAPAVTNCFQFKTDGSEPLSRIAATINLCYHQCIVLATRPLLMCLLRDKLESVVGESTKTREMVAPVKVLLQTCYESAKASIQILELLKGQDLLELFLPFDVDIAFSAGFVLALIASIHPDPESVPHSTKSTCAILDAFVDGGNAPARFRRQEFLRFDEMLRSFHQKHAANFNPSTVESDPAPLKEGILYGLSPGSALNVVSLMDSYPRVDFVDNMGWLWKDGYEHGVGTGTASNWEY